MKSKTCFVSVVICGMIALAGCAGVNSVSKDISLDNLPSGKSFWDLSSEDRMFTVNILFETTKEECEELLKKDIEELIKDDEIISVNTVKILEDNLSIDRYGNKPFANFVTDITFEVQKAEGSKKEIEAKLEEFGHRTYISFDGLDRALLYNRKISKVNMIFVDDKSNVLYDMVMNPVMVGEMPEEFKVKLDEDEGAAQGLAFEYASSLEIKESPEDPNKSFVPLLNKFGILESSRDLYIEIEIIDKYYLEDNIGNVYEYFETKSKELAEKLMIDVQSKSFMENNKTEKIVISFYVPWFEEEYITFNHGVSKG